MIFNLNVYYRFKNVTKRIIIPYDNFGFTTKFKK